MDFVTKSFWKDETLTSWTLLQHICPHFWAWFLNTIAITPKSEDKYVQKVFNWSEVHLSEMTCYKIHTLAGKYFQFHKDFSGQPLQPFQSCYLWYQPIFFYLLTKSNWTLNNGTFPYLKVFVCSRISLGFVLIFTKTSY